MNKEVFKSDGEIRDPHEHFPNLPLLDCINTTFQFDDQSYDIIYCDPEVKISTDESNFAIITLKDQRVPSESAIMNGSSISVQKTGHIDFLHHLDVVWTDQSDRPEIIFIQEPLKIIRNYLKGQRIELGIEDVSRYHVEYQDGVTGDFDRVAPRSYNFSFSTGFYGSFVKEEDGSHTIRFKGLPMESDEEGYVSESKFIITRSKYTNNLLLVLQDKATVLLSH
jgi:hypothetical protein